MKKLMQLGVCIFMLAAGAAAQTVTGSGTTGTVPVFNGTSSVTNSPITVSGSNVGIGTSSPLSALTLAGSNTANPNTGPQVDFNGENLTFENTTAGVALGGIKMVQPTGYYLDAGDMVFSTSYGSLSEKMRITAQGNVILGATNPANGSHLSRRHEPDHSLHTE